ncbi:MAG: tetratricopeptide repeat protein [Verrucomicrobiaceae bacterium]|nr:tetratricopeptide repeat protein [Verrucomicrobiaceae bacterium]
MGWLCLRHVILRRGLDDLDESNCDEATLARLICLAEEEGNPSDLLKLARIYSYKKEWEKLLDAFEKLVASRRATQEQQATANFYAGIAFCETGRLNEAISAYKISVESTQREDLKAWAHYNLGTTLAQAGFTLESVSEFTKLLELKSPPLDPLYQGLVNRGSALMDLGRVSEALEDFDRVINAADAPREQKATALVNRGVVEGTKLDLDAALKTSSQVLAMLGIPQGIRARAAFLSCMTLNESGRPKEFCNDLFEVLENTDMPTVREILVPNHQIVSIALIRAIHDQPVRAWPVAISRVIGSFSRLGYLPSLGRSLISHLGELDWLHRSHEALDFWISCWRDASAKLDASARAVMAIPLRWLSAGIEYLKAHDENILLSLPLEERRILRAVLKSPPETQP